MREKTKSSNKVFSNDFLTLYLDEVILPDENESSRVYVKHPGAAAVLPLTTDGKIILTEQFRYPIRDITLEVPAGKKDDINESGFDCVKRELEEETGYQSDNIVHVVDTHTCLGYSDELLELFIAYDCYKVDNPLQPDDDEFIRPVLFDYDEVVSLLKENKITDAKTIILFQHYMMSR